MSKEYYIVSNEQVVCGPVEERELDKTLKTHAWFGIPSYFCIEDIHIQKSKIQVSLDEFLEIFQE